MIHTVLRTINRLITKRNQHTSRNHFYFNKIYFTRIAHLFEVFKEKQEKGQVYQTKETIQPLGLRFSSSYKDVLKVMDKPSYIYNNQQTEHNHKALLVRHTISNISMLVQLQFYNDQLFFIGLDVSKNIKTDAEKAEIINTVILKYSNKPFCLGDESPVIKDEAGNVVMINDDVNFSICYFDGTISQHHKNIKRPKEGSSSTKNTSKKDKESLFYAF
jgi:hypothetical protein